MAKTIYDTNKRAWVTEEKDKLTGIIDYAQVNYPNIPVTVTATGFVIIEKNLTTNQKNTAKAAIDAILDA